MRMMDDTYYMRFALQLAESAQGQTGINPVVGAVVVKDGRIVGTGTHLRRGGPHAEVYALDMAGGEAEGATVYVTLEPCSHHGKTPPCADRLIQEKVARVVIAATDPNPNVAGRGIARLRENGIEVVTGVLEQESRRLNEHFEHYIRTRTPFVTLKSAMTLDGKIASRTGDSKWISNEKARAHVHALRHQHQGIMVGIGTVLADDPQLNTRLPVPGIDPVRIIVDARLELPVNAKVLQQASETSVYVLTTEQASSEQAIMLEQRGASILRCGSGPRVDLKQAMRKLGELEISSVLLEGGGKLNGAMLEAGLVNKVILFAAPLILGGQEAHSVFDFTGFSRVQDAIRLRDMTASTIDDNIAIIGYPIYGGETG